MRALRPEDELMLCSARTLVDDRGAERMRSLLRGGIDWASFIESAGRQGVLPLVYRTLRTRFPDAVPERAFHKLRLNYAANLGHNIMLTRELHRIIDLLETSGVRSIPIKGPSLAVYAYGDLALRSFGDLDLLVRARDVAKVRTIFTENGYHPSLELPRDQEPRFLRFHFERAFAHRDRPVLFEVHWALDYPYYSFAAVSERSWERCQTIALEGRPILSLAPEELLIFLCAHGAKHRWERLAWICDVAELTRNCCSLRWDDVIDRAEQSGCKRMLGLGLLLANELLGAPLPGDVAERTMGDRAVPALAARVRDSLFGETEGGHLEDGEPEVNFFFIRTMLNPGDRVKGLLGALLIPNAFELGLVPSYAFVFPLYFLIRPLRLMGKALKWMAGGFRSRNSELGTRNADLFRAKMAEKTKISS